MSELQKARTSVENYRVEHQAYPDNLEQTNYQKVQGIDVHFGDRTTDRYTIIATHSKGDREFAAESDSAPDILYRVNREKDDEYNRLNEFYRAAACPSPRTSKEKHSASKG